MSEVDRSDTGKQRKIIGSIASMSDDTVQVIAGESGTAFSWLNFRPYAVVLKEIHFQAAARPAAGTAACNSRSRIEPSAKT